MKLFWIVFKIQVFWKLGHETLIETGLSKNNFIPSYHLLI